MQLRVVHVLVEAPEAREDGGRQLAAHRARAIVEHGAGDVGDVVREPVGRRLHVHADAQNGMLEVPRLHVHHALGEDARHLPAVAIDVVYPLDE